MTDLDTATARQRILARIRSAQGRPGAPTANGRRPVDDWIARREVGPQPTVDADRVAHFERQAARMSTTTERVVWLADVPAAVDRDLDAHGLPKRAVCGNTLDDLDRAGADLELEACRPQGDDMVGISGALVAVGAS